ncbi:MAG: hypothetical protein ABI609_05505 [Acidobacteriota bacterium]
MKVIIRVLALTLTLSASTLWAQAEEYTQQQQPTTSAQTDNPAPAAPAEPTAIAPPEIRQAVGAVASVSSTSLLLNSDAGAQLNFVADDKSTVPADLKANDRVSVDYTELTDGSLHVERVSLVTAASAPLESAALASAILAENPPEVATTPEATLPATVSDEPRPRTTPAKATPRQTLTNSVKAAPEPKEAQSTLPQASATTPVPSTVALSTETEPIPPTEATDQSALPTPSVAPVDAKPTVPPTSPMRRAFPFVLFAGGLAFLTFLGIRQARHEA